MKTNSLELDEAKQNRKGRKRGQEKARTLSPPRNPLMCTQESTCAGPVHAASVCEFI